jgi:clan AA aspartic protease
MITGMVNADLEAILSLIVFGSGGQRQQIEAIIDTGFSGFLTLPPALIGTLGLAWLGRELGVLADGTAAIFDVYGGTVEWESTLRTVEVESSDTEPLLGTALLEGHELRMQVVDGGAATVARMP